jgi:hypothetical protein
VREGFDLYDLGVEALEGIPGLKLSRGGLFCTLSSARRCVLIVAPWLAGGSSRRRAAIELRLGRRCLFQDWTFPRNRGT